MDTEGVDGADAGQPEPQPDDPAGMDHWVSPDGEFILDTDGGLEVEGVVQLDDPEAMPALVDDFESALADAGFSLGDPPGQTQDQPEGGQ